MATNNEEPDLARTPLPIATPFTLAARSIVSEVIEALEDLDEALDY